jgi:hypothetical protein
MSAPTRPGAAAQLDLFVDGAETVLLHAVGAALAAGSREAVDAALVRLRRHDPAHPDLVGLQSLAEAIRPGLPAPASWSALEAVARELDAVLVPTAERLLGRGATAVLGPLWRRLAAGAAGGVDVAEGGGHVRFWVGAAHYHLGRRTEALRLWLSIAWRDPGALAILASRCPDDTIRLAWLAFDRGPGFEIPEEPDAAARWFPAWVFLRHRELGGLFQTHEIGGPLAGPAEAAARAVVALLPLEVQGLSDAVVRGRRALKEAAPAFFQHYLRRVAR